MSTAAEPSTGRRSLSRLSCLASLALLGLTGWLSASDAQVARGLRIEIVATDVPRPAQLALTTSGRLVVLSHGWRGDSAAEIYWLDPAGVLPINASHAPRLVIPFAEGPRKTALGSLAVEPRSGDLYLGEENGNRIYRLAAARRLSPLAVGLNHLLGGSSIALDPQGRLVVLDYASFESQLRSESPMPPSLESLAVEDYTGPLVFRIDPQEDVPLPRNLEVVAPIFPKRPARRVPGEPLHKFIAVAPTRPGRTGAAQLGGRSPRHVRGRRSQAPGPASVGTLSPDQHGGGTRRQRVRLGGFHIRELYRVSPAGVVTSVAHASRRSAGNRRGSLGRPLRRRDGAAPHHPHPPRPLTIRLPRPSRP